MFHDDEIVRMRASDALEKVSRERPDLLDRFAKRLLTDVPKVDQPSVQWHLAQMLPRLRLSPIDRRRAVAVLKRNLDHHDDWIVVNLTLEALADFARQNPRLRTELLELLDVYEDDQHKSVASRAKKLIAEFRSEVRRPKRQHKNQTSFTGTVETTGINPFLAVPPEVVHSPALRGSRFVRAKIAKADRQRPANRTRSLGLDREPLVAIGRLGRGGWFRTSLVPIRGGARLYIDHWMRHSARVDVGDRVQVVLKPDLGSRDLTVPSALAKELARHQDANALWKALSASRRREILSYLNFLKTDAAIERNVRKVIADLEGKGGGGHGRSHSDGG
jgi:hypothetical protein